jgi:hypothetical protein
MNIEIILTAHIITEENKAFLTTEYEADDVKSSSNGGPTSFEPGYIAIVRELSVPDVISPHIHNRITTVWIVPKEEFDSKFDLIDDIWRTKEFGRIRRKR